MLAAPGADNVKLQLAIAKLLPSGVQVVSGQSVASELSSAVDNELSFISTALLIFAGIALFVGGFTIFNTFSITVGQRTRELALLRVVGASRRQVFRSVLGEAALLGMGASLIGLGLGVVAAIGLKALLKAFGIVLPSAPLVFEARTVVVAIVVGVGVTVLSAIVPARRAVRIAPVAALVDRSEDQPESLRRRRVIAGGVFAVAGVAAVLRRPRVAGDGPRRDRRAGGVRRRRDAGADRRAAAVGRARSAAGGAARNAGPARTGELDAQPAPHRPDSRRADDRVGARVDDRGPRRIAQHFRQGSGRQRGQRRLHRHRATAASARRSSPTVSRLPGVTTATTVYRGQFEFRGSLSTLAAATPATSIADGPRCTSPPAAARRRWRPASC